MTALHALALRMKALVDAAEHPQAELLVRELRNDVRTLALGCFATAQFLGDSGFIAVFTGGLLFGVLAKDHRDEFLRATEGTGDTLSLITWVIFGSAVVGKALGHFSWPILFYAILSLTIIRLLPVCLSLAGAGQSTEGKLFIGWFGPRGLASIVSAVIVTKTSEDALDLDWPEGLYSLSHVALPFPVTDPLYGGRHGIDSPGIRLGSLALRGERGVLRVSASGMLRLRWNPFYPYLERRVKEFVKPGATPH